MAVEDVEMPVEIEELYSAFEAADNILLKKYVSKLSEATCKNINSKDVNSEDEDNFRLYEIFSIVYDKNENVQDKLTSVYSTISSLKQCGLIMILNATKEKVNLYMGIRGNEETEVKNNAKTLKNAFEGNFPGIKMENVLKKNIEKDPSCKTRKKVVEVAINQANVIASVSSIPALRNAKEHKNIEFIQGIEKLIESMRGKSYSAIIIADAVSNDEIEEMCAEYENIYSQLSPFKTSDQTISKQEGTNTSESIIKGTTETINEMLTKSTSHGTNSSETKTKGIGGGIGGGIGINPLIFANANINGFMSNSKSNGTSDAKTDSKSNGTAKSVSEQNSTSSGKSTSESNSVRITFENRSVKTLMDRVDEQIKRLRSCEDFGMFDTCAYFTSADYDVALAATSVFKSVTRGENSSVESSAVNIWSEDDKVEEIKKYLLRLYHPEFEYKIGDETYSVKPSLLMSGKELAFEMSLPKKSVPGIPVIECAEFGREVTSLDSKDGNYQSVELGKIYHMHDVDENTPVKLDVQSLTSHTFITGSTGAGKSNAIYQLLSELSHQRIETENQDGTERPNIKFMVIEPAKGEYKDVFGKQNGTKVFGTNPKLMPLLRINPFKFPKTIHIYEHLDRLVEIFNVCWPMYAAMPAVLKAAMENAYRSAGWNLVKSENKYGDIFPSFIDVAIEVEKYINKSEYSDENKSNYKGSLLTRLESLTNGINGMIFSSDDLSDKELFDENVIVDLSRVGSTETKALIMGILVLKLQEYRMTQSDSNNSPLKHVTVLEEAHNLLKRTSTEQNSESANLLGKSVEMLTNAIAEMRTYGEGFIIADQSPGLLDLAVIRNTNTKIIMRLPEFSDRELVGKAASLNDDQISELARLPRGVAAVYQNEWIGPILCQVNKGPEGQKYKLDKKQVLSYNKNILFDLLGSISKSEMDKEKVDSLKAELLKSTVSADVKVKLLEYLNSNVSAQKINALTSAVFDYFKNTKITLDKTIDGEDIYELKADIITNLEPSIIEYDDEQINLIITLIINEYINRYHIDYPIWQEFVIKVAKEEVK